MRWRNECGGGVGPGNPDCDLGLRPLDRRDDLFGEVVHREGADMLEADRALGIDDEGFGDAVDAPVDGGAAVSIGAF